MAQLHIDRGQIIAAKALDVRLMLGLMDEEEKKTPSKQVLAQLAESRGERCHSRLDIIVVEM